MMAARMTVDAADSERRLGCLLGHLPGIGRCPPSKAPAAASPVAGAAAGTEILWDTYGVPHIFAPDHPSLFHAYGYAQMEAHSELLLSLYAQAQGRGAEFYSAELAASGSSPEQRIPDTVLQADRWVRTNGVPATARRWAEGQSAEFGPLIEAFAAGVNAVRARPGRLSALSVP
jgi:acyl-homoserine-lactone acylase